MTRSGALEREGNSEEGGGREGNDEGELLRSFPSLGPAGPAPTTLPSQQPRI